MLAPPLSCEARRAGRLRNCAVDIEFDSGWQFDDCFEMVVVLEQRIFEGLGAADEQAVLLLGNPVALVVSADENNGGDERTTRGRFDKFTFAILPKIGLHLSEASCLREVWKTALGGRQLRLCAGIPLGRIGFRERRNRDRIGAA